jgi:RNA polymerase sigma-70 factor (ECF subfamily)
MREATPLSDVLLQPTGGVGSPELERALATALSTGRTAWPEIAIDDGAMLAYVAARLPDGTATAGAIDALHASDLYLACGCAHGDVRAIAYFETRFLGEVADFVAQIDSSATFADEVRQRLREKLLVSEDGTAPKISEYAGRGPLGGWLRVAAVRTALNLRRDDYAHNKAATARRPQVAPTADPEIDYLKTRYGDELRQALQAALESLGTDERNVLRMHYIDGLNIDEIGSAYRVHRSTVARWLAASREDILVETKRILAVKLRIDDGEVDSMIELVRSQINISIRRLLEQTPVEPPRS